MGQQKGPIPIWLLQIVSFSTYSRIWVAEARGCGRETRSKAVTMSAEDLENGEFYLRYYVGHKGKFGHEFLEFEFRPDGKLRYANNSNYKNDTMIRKEVYLTPAVLRECRRIISDSEVRILTSLPLPLCL